MIVDTLKPSAEAISAGLMVEQGSEVRITEAGLFAIACMLAFAADTDEDERTRMILGVDTALSEARRNGLNDYSAGMIIRAFREGLVPIGPTAEGRDLARLCCNVSRLVGAGKMRRCFEWIPSNAPAFH